MMNNQTTSRPAGLLPVVITGTHQHTAWPHITESIDISSILDMEPEVTIDRVEQDGRCTRYVVTEGMDDVFTCESYGEALKLAIDHYGWARD